MYNEHTEPGGHHPAQPDSENHNIARAKLNACRAEPPDFPPPEQEVVVTIYDCGSDITFALVHIDKVAWCELNGAGAIAGVAVHAITGYLPEDEECTKGAPGYLDPDGIINLYQFGLLGYGIRLDALRPYVEQNRQDNPRLLRFVKSLSNANPRCGIRSEGLSKPITVHRPELLGDAIVHCPIFNPDGPERGLYYFRYYDPECGEMGLVVVGCQVWLRLKDVAFATKLEQGALIEIAQPERILSVPAHSIRNVCDLGVNYTFMRIDAVDAIASAMHWGMPILDSGLKVWIRKDLLNPQKLKDRGLHVSANTLHCLLGAHLPFDAWAKQIQIKCLEIISRNLDCDLLGIDCDSIIPITIARDIALKEGSFAGIVTARLLTDGGVFHGGWIGETPDDTLLRFVALVPDREGRVDLQKLWEFAGATKPFKEWFRKGLDCLPDREDPPLDEKVSITSWWCESVWTNNCMPSI